MEISLDINAFNQEILHMQQGLTEYISKALPAETLTTFAKIKNRIQEKGQGSGGEELPMYSFAYKEKKEARYGAVSVKFRNLTLTGAMWRDHGITSTEQEQTGLTVTISGENQSAKDKARWNADQIGDFMKTSAKEEKESTADFQHGIDNYLKKL